jgi:hypothetical protein
MTFCSKIFISKYPLSFIYDRIVGILNSTFIFKSKHGDIFATQNKHPIYSSFRIGDVYGVSQDLFQMV